MEQKALWKRYVDGARAKTAGGDKLDESRVMRELIVEDFGGHLPQSLMPIGHTTGPDYPDPLAEGTSTIGYTDERPTDKCGAQKAGGGQRLSIFSRSLALKCIRLWSDPGDMVLDPFAGRGARLQAALELGRSYIGFDPSREAIKACNGMLCNADGDFEGFFSGHYRRERTVTLLQENSLYLDKHVGLESVDLVFTCPPYGASEFYGDNAGLESLADYTDYLQELSAILVLATAALRPDGYLVLVIRNWCQNSQKLTVTADLTRVLVATKQLVFWDEVAVQYGTTRCIFHQDVVQHRRTAQIHEYVLVFRKAKARKGKRRSNTLTFVRNKKRKKIAAELRQRREEILREHQVSWDAVRPVLWGGGVFG